MGTVLPPAGMAAGVASPKMVVLEDWWGDANATVKAGSSTLGLLSTLMTLSTVQMMLAGIPTMLPKYMMALICPAALGSTKQLAKQMSQPTTHTRAIVPNALRNNHSMFVEADVAPSG